MIRTRLQSCAPTQSWPASHPGAELAEGARSKCDGIALNSVKAVRTQPFSKIQRGHATFALG